MRILISTDGSEFSKAAIDACRKIVFDPEKTSFRIVSAVAAPLMPADPFVGVSANYYDRIEQVGYALAKQILDESADRLRALFPAASLDLTTEVMDGSPVRVIVEEAERWNADLIVVGSHGYGFWNRALLGSVSGSILHYAPCSVLVMRAKRNAIEAA
ncbi:MAG TPA: universal stress protein [Pyrinomonadaceae bacterium]|jgi:nucleotide-binding universal stress UspA family protein